MVIVWQLGLVILIVDLMINTPDLNHRYSIALPLSVKGVDFVILYVIEALCREILGATVNLKHSWTRDSIFSPVPEQMMVLNFLVVEQVHENYFIIDEAAVNEWIREVVDWHGVVV